MARRCPPHRKQLIRAGHIVKRIIVDPAALAAWCALRGLQPIGSARANYISEQLRQQAKPSARRQE